jgi:uncharacterized protein (DUF849 family)
MSKKIPCFICGVLTEVKDERAIAALCSTHKTTANIEKMKNTPTHQLLRILNDGVKQELEINKTETTKQIESLKNQITQLEAKLKTQETKVQEVYEAPKAALEIKPDGTVNEWGEVV